MLSKIISNVPLSFNIDFEKAVSAAIKIVFGVTCEIYGCYFHLCQSFFRNVNTKGYFVDFVSNTEFKKCFLLTQSLSFLPINNVIDGFLIIKQYAEQNCEKYLFFLSYIEEYYIGVLDKTNQIRKKPAFPIETWNIHDRILNNKPRSSNNVERWNKQIQNDSGDHHLAVCTLIENLRLEQGLTESTIVQINSGVENKKSSIQIQLDKQYLNILKSFNHNDLFEFLNKISLVIDSFNDKMKRKNKTNYAHLEEDY